MFPAHRKLAVIVPEIIARASRIEHSTTYGMLCINSFVPALLSTWLPENYYKLTEPNDCDGVEAPCGDSRRSHTTSTTITTWQLCCGYHTRRNVWKIFDRRLMKKTVRWTNFAKSTTRMRKNMTIYWLKFALKE